jgi:hypothetical protein
MPLTRLLASLATLAVTGCTTTLPNAAESPADTAAPVQSGLDLPTPTGSSVVANSTRVWVDGTRIDDQALMPGGARELVVELWYPADTGATGSAAAYMTDAEGAAIAAQGPVTVAGWQDRVRDHALSEPPLVSDGARHPILLFSPAFGLPRQFYAGLLENLASHGYVVVAISHLDDTAPVELPNGAMVPLGPFASGAPTTADLDAHVALWATDQAFVLDRVKQLDDCDDLNIFTSRLDLTRVGVFGDGFGGAAAITLGQTDARVRAIADLGGFVYGPARTATAPLVAPLLVVDFGAVAGSTAALWQSGTAGSELSLANAGSRSATDLGLLTDAFELPHDPTVFGTIDPAIAIAAIDAQLMTFFGQALR